MPNPTFSKPILIPAILIILALAGSIFVYAYIQTKETNFTQPPNPVSTNQALKPTETIKPTEPEPTEPAKLETYKSELFIQAKWGKGRGEVGMLYNPDEIGKEGDIGPNYGPQSFDIDEATGHLFLLDSVNSRVIEYDEAGKYTDDFPIKYSLPEDIRVKDNFIYIFEYGIPAISKYTTSGEFVEDYKILSSEVIESPFLGLEFDMNSNIMLGSMGREKGVKYGSFEAGRKYKFYQIGKNGDEYKNNNYIGYQSKDGMKYYLLGGIKEGETREKRYVLVLNKDGILQREIKIELPRIGLAYFSGLDKNDNIYLEIQYSGGGGGIEIRKYNQNGKLLAVLEVSELAKKNDFMWWFTRIFKKQRVSENGDVYLMFSDTKEIKIYKYSQVE